jgi:hypothetical protein
MVEHLEAPGTIAAANQLIEEMQAEKAKLHAQPDNK